MKKFSRIILNALLNPYTRVTNPEKIQRSRLLSTILLIQALVIGLIIALVIHADPNDINEPTIKAAFLTAGVSIVLYIANRFGYTSISALLYFLVFAAIFIYIPFYSGENPAFLAFMIIPLIFMAIFFTIKQTTFAGLGIIILIGVLLSFMDHSRSNLLYWNIRNMWYFLMLAAGLILTFMRHLNNLEQIRQTELKRINEQLEQKVAELERLTSRLETLHEIDRALITARPTREIAKDALNRIRMLIPCMRASATLFDFSKNEASFLNADFDKIVPIPDTPIPLAEFGLNVIETLKQNKPWFTSDMLKESEVTPLDERLAYADGIYAWLSLPLLYQGQLIGALSLGRGPGESFNAEDAAAAQDVANQLAIAIRQTDLHNALQSELHERQKFITKLEANNAELERFTYTVSHDLRNPLVTIKGFLGMLNQDIQENNQERIQKDFKRIAGAADKMDELLSDLLELSRVGRIINPPEETDLIILVKETLEILDARIRSKNVSVRIAPDLPIMYCDRVRLREVFENLIANAVKYTGRQPNPAIEIGVRSTQDEQIIFVQDNGMGIEARYLTRIFTLFEKLDPTIEGTGIGLALVKRIIETHGGRIWAESAGLGKGSTFCFTIPDNRK
jgi:signal transduction histidine kinase